MVQVELQVKERSYDLMDLLPIALIGIVVGSIIIGIQSIYVLSTIDILKVIGH